MNEFWESLKATTEVESELWEYSPNLLIIQLLLSTLWIDITLPNMAVE